MELIDKYFPGLTEKQRNQFDALDALYREWNARINVISRKDIDQLYLHHVLHSLAIAEAIRFKPRTCVMDLGTGGGFPGIPLAIMFPETSFHLVDSVGKKIRVCQEVSRALELQNVTTQWCRAEEVERKFHFVVSRAVMPLPDLVKIARKKVCGEQFNGLPNGLLCLKGGELQDELRPLGKAVETMPVGQFFEEDYFATKKLIYMAL